MNNILVIGAGRSATALINYVLDQAKKYNWNVTVSDNNLDAAKEKVNNHPNGRAVWLDVMKVNDRRDLIGRADVVVSLLPAHLHLEVGHDCILLKKHLITASYVSKEMYQLGDDARDRDLIFMGEMGLDPGVDHMSAMEKINEIKEKGGELTAFRSFTGGLIAPECNDNPWNYKFTWNPRNVVLAGKGTAQYLENSKLKYIPYNRLFKDIQPVEIDGVEGDYEGYANRDSLLYCEKYGLEGIPSILRGTIRNAGYCEAWNALIRIGLTDSSYPILDSDKLTYHGLMEAYVGNEHKGNTVKERIASLLKIDVKSEVMKKLEWIGLFSKKRINLSNATPALILEHLLLDKWKLQPEDKDMILMQHQFEYELEGKKHLLTSTLIMKGAGSHDTAMARLVGLPMGIFVKLVLQGRITQKGVNIPVMKEVYAPVLKELKDFGVEFVDKDVVIG
jgi:saccharopine dehydrogenase-like NADP-dependent oxidoreductase